MFQKRIDHRKKEGNDRPAPTKTLPRIWDMLVNHFFQLLWANLLCVICCLPIITIPAALSGLFAVVQQYYRKGYGDVAGTFFKEFKQDFLIRVAMTLIMLVLPVLGWVIGSMFSAEWAPYAGCAALAVFAIFTLSWLYPQMALLRLKPMQALQNAMILTGLESKRNLGFLLVWVIFGGVTWIMWPLSFVLLLFLVPIAPVIIIDVLAEPVIERRIIGKIEQEEVTE